MRNFVFLFLCVGVAGVCAGRTITVDDGNPSADAWDIRSGMGLASDGDTVVIAPGLYTGFWNRDLDFMGKAITVRSQDPNDPNVVAATVMDIDGTMSSRHLGFRFQSGEGPDSVVDGLTIIDGFGPTIHVGPHVDVSGYAVLIQGSNPTIRNCVISGDHRGILCCEGGALIENCRVVDCEYSGIESYESILRIERCSISGNGAGLFLNWDDSEGAGSVDIVASHISGNGFGLDSWRWDIAVSESEIAENYYTGIFVSECNLAVADCVVKRNGSIGPSGGIYWGGGISCWVGHVVITGCEISRNIARLRGGGIRTLRTDLEITDCKITDNTAGGFGSQWYSRGFGGGIYCGDSETFITDCLISGNMAVDLHDGYTEGGGIWSDRSLETVNCRIEHNTAIVGGGMHCSGDMNVANCIIAGNRAYDRGGGLSCGGGVVKNCTFVGNRSQEGSGLAGPCAVTNSILWDETTRDFISFELSQEIAGSALVSYCDVRGGWPGEGNIDAEPLFAFDGDYHLMPGSPCVDAGTNDPCGGLDVWDFDGWVRPVDGDEDGLAVADMGAYELDPAGPTIGVMPTSLTFVTLPENPEPQVLQIRNRGTGVLDWELVEDCNWLHAAPMNGLSVDDINEVLVTVDANELRVGDYNCVVRVADANALNSPVEIEVVLHVGRVLNVPNDFNTIQAAIDAANDWDIVMIADGTYTGDGNRGLDFRGKAIRVRSANGPGDCIIDCDGSEPHRGFYFHSGENEYSVVSGVTITKGRATADMSIGDYGNELGGGIYCKLARPTISGCRIIENGGAGLGGGICCYQAGPTIVDCNISGNTGGGIYWWQGLGSINGGVISDNSAGYSGGGIGIDGAVVAIRDCSITGNYADWGGGGVYGGQIEMSNCNVSRNQAGLGAGLYDCGGIISESVISENRARLSGGGIDWFYGDIDNSEISANLAEMYDGGGLLGHVGELRNCRVVGNRAADCGGGAYYGYAEDVTLKGNLFAGNWSGTDGGALYFVQQISPVITNCTFVGNCAEGHGSSVACAGGPPGSVRITNCIVWDGDEQIWNDNDSEILISYSDVLGGVDAAWDAGGNLNVNPGFAFEGDYHLTAESLCIDAGVNDPCGGLASGDLDGNPRVSDGDGDSNAVVDLGVYEFNPNRPLMVVSRASVTFHYVQGWTQPEPQVVGVRNCGGGVLRWQAGGDCDWLEISPRSGDSEGEVDEITLNTVNLDALSKGMYTCTLEVVDCNGVNSPRSIEVTLHVGDILRVRQDFDTIQAAIDAAADYDMVLVEDSVYRGNGNRDLDFEGKAIAVRSANGPQNCIIDCQGSPAARHRAFDFHSGEDSESLVDGFTIVGGYAADPGSPYGNGSDGGGAIRCGRSEPAIRNCIFRENRTAGVGGAVHCYDCSPVIENCLFEENASGRFGGGLGSYYEKNLLLLDCVFWANTSAQGGAVGAWSAKCLTLANCELIENTAALRGGAVLAFSSQANFVNCLVVGNRVGREGGAILTMGSQPLKLRNCTIVGNYAAQMGGALRSLLGLVQVTNTVLGSNLAQDGNDICCTDGSGAEISYSCVESGQGGVVIEGSGELQWGPGNIEGEPCFVAAGYWGDANDVNVVVEPFHPNAVWVDGDYHLLASSPCIDTGDPNYIAAPNETDLDGCPRIIDGNNDGLAIIDMGAYEYLPPIEAHIRIMPRVLNLRNRGRFILAFIRLPEPYNVADINQSSLMLEGQIPAGRTAIIESRNVALARFNCRELLELTPGRVELTVTGRLTDQTPFEGTDTIRIVPKPPK